MSQNVRVILIGVALVILALLAGQYAYNAGEWIGRH